MLQVTTAEHSVKVAFSADEIVDFAEGGEGATRHVFQNARYDLERYLLYGGYPGAVAYEGDYDRWYAYLKEAIVEAVIGKDILLNRKVGNPALFRQAFEILCRYPAQEISYTKLLGQFAGGTLLLAGEECRSRFCLPLSGATERHRS